MAFGPLRAADVLSDLALPGIHWFGLCLGLFVEPLGVVHLWCLGQRPPSTHSHHQWHVFNLGGHKSPKLLLEMFVMWCRCVKATELAVEEPAGLPPAGCDHSPARWWRTPLRIFMDPCRKPCRNRRGWTVAEHHLVAETGYQYGCFSLESLLVFPTSWTTLGVNFEWDSLKQEGLKSQLLDVQSGPQRLKQMCLSFERSAEPPFHSPQNSSEAQRSGSHPKYGREGGQCHRQRAPRCGETAPWRQTNGTALRGELQPSLRLAMQTPPVAELRKFGHTFLTKTSGGLVVEQLDQQMPWEYYWLLLHVVDRGEYERGDPLMPPFYILCRTLNLQIWFMIINYF